MFVFFVDNFCVPDAVRTWFYRSVPFGGVFFFYIIKMFVGTHCLRNVGLAAILERAKSLKKDLQLLRRRSKATASTKEESLLAATFQSDVIEPFKSYCSAPKQAASDGTASTSCPSTCDIAHSEEQLSLGRSALLYESAALYDTADTTFLNLLAAQLAQSLAKAEASRGHVARPLVCILYAAAHLGFMEEGLLRAVMQHGTRSLAAPRYMDLDTVSCGKGVVALGAFGASHHPFFLCLVQQLEQRLRQERRDEQYSLNATFATKVLEALCQREWRDTSAAVKLLCDVVLWHARQNPRSRMHCLLMHRALSMTTSAGHKIPWLAAAVDGMVAEAGGVVSYTPSGEGEYAQFDDVTADFVKLPYAGGHVKHTCP